MESLYDPKGNQNILDRIDQLNPMTLSQWGVMTVSQMMQHCQEPIKMAFGILHVKPHWKSYFFASSYRKKLNSAKLFHKDQSTIQEFIIKYEPKFDVAKDGLKALVATFAKDGHAAIKATRHPLLGEMTYAEWDILQWKHLDYHLKQFGV
ncbi:DUF1569 domain-containing protein [Flavobacterium subsaxonicum]|uniref:DUF1569 domain-containing protein n=1 Tax=Flavobacterium subsaxonicum WB 4.1-42 = DSM 21790 TaxID=1121898 RepID=A0A0A2MM90_9FLAO|nr:DUF1569 domain-containing protein [Flavobacterium subsaxonicum]KGO93757.1 hypothetical protein Q766_07340 [Flavobacterium subsaxonicum WB 4.1-42 = DSM 21790]